MEHVKDAKSFSKKSHIVKHWMSVHPEHPNPPPFKFKVTQQFKDCMSRQVAEAIRIQHTKDNILNSKCEYLQNCITRLTVNEEVWERKERERREEETEKEEADNLERFKRDKLSIRQKEEDPRTGQKRKRGVACLEEEMPRMVDADQHERVGEGQHEHEQHLPEVQHQDDIITVWRMVKMDRMDCMYVLVVVVKGPGDKININVLWKYVLGMKEARY